MQRSQARGHSAKPPAAAAQLISRRRSFQQLRAGADEPHTNRKILRRPFSTCNMHMCMCMQNRLANSEDQAHHIASSAGCSWCVQPSLHSDLADEHEHVERAGLGHVHHEGEVLDAQASAPASSSLGDHARHPLISPYRCSIARYYCPEERGEHRVVRMSETVVSNTHDNV